jgi:hypothetical protein
VIGEKGVKPIKCISINTTSVYVDDGWTRLTFYSIILLRESRKEGLSLNVIVEVLCRGRLEAKEWTSNPSSNEAFLWKDMQENERVTASIKRHQRNYFLSHNS